MADTLDSAPAPGSSLADRYLDLVEAILVNSIYQDSSLPSVGDAPDAGTLPYNPKTRRVGLDWPSQALTMVGERRLRNFRTLIQHAIASGTPGDIIETGVWRGGASILARAVLAAMGVTDRKVILADSFEGLPAPNASAYPADADSKLHTFRELAIPLETVRDNFRKFDLLDEQVVFLKGWFSETLAKAPSTAFAVIRLDGDMYESTTDALVALYDRLSVGGWVIIDDYGILKSCQAAVHDFFGARGYQPELSNIDGIGRYFQKTASMD